MIHNRKLRIVKFVFIAIAFVALVSLATMLLWNWLVPVIFKGPEINYLQSIGLIILSRILLCGHGRGFHGHSHWKRHEDWRKRMHERWEHMSPEEREQWKKKCGYWYREDWDKKPNTPESTGSPEQKA
ncbi:MAG: hypothetical protein ACHQJ4_03515 [Ignavibacteria bacterium]